MGLGKTLQTLAWLLWLREQPAAARDSRALVVCPKSVMDNWHAEAARFTPGLRVRVWPAGELAKLRHRTGLGGFARAELQPAPGPGRKPGRCAVAGGDPRRRTIH